MFPDEKENCPSMFYEKVCDIFDEHNNELVDVFVKMVIATILILPVHEHGPAIFLLSNIFFSSSMY